MHLFKAAAGNETTLSAEKARDILTRSELDANTLLYIWFVFGSLFLVLSLIHIRLLSDTTRSGSLYFPEFALAMYLCNMKLQGKPLPSVVPENWKTGVSKLVERIISREPAKNVHNWQTASIGKSPPDFSIRRSPQPTIFGPEQGLSSGFPIEQNVQSDYVSPLAQNLDPLSQYDPQDFYVHHPPLTQPYALKIPQAEGKSSQQEGQNAPFNVFKVSKIQDKDTSKSNNWTPETAAFERAILYLRKDTYREDHPPFSITLR